MLPTRRRDLLSCPKIPMHLPSTESRSLALRSGAKTSDLRSPGGRYSWPNTYAEIGLGGALIRSPRYELKLLQNTSRHSRAMSVKYEVPISYIQVICVMRDILLTTGCTYIHGMPDCCIQRLAASSAKSSGVQQVYLMYSGVVCCMY